jgi:hypothetical protein
MSSVKTVVTPEKVVTNRQDIVEQARGREEHDDEGKSSDDDTMVIVDSPEYGCHDDSYGLR